MGASLEALKRDGVTLEPITSRDEEQSSIIKYDLEAIITNYPWFEKIPESTMCGQRTCKIILMAKVTISQPTLM